MMGELNLIQVCDHTVATMSNSSTDITIVRGPNLVDVIVLVAGSPTKIIQITDSMSTVLSADIYNLYGTQIVWVDTGLATGTPSRYRTPATGESYIVSLQYVTLTAQSYAANSCPKCGGHGWYVDVTDVAGMRSITGVEQVAQEYLKCLLTQRGTDPLFPDYGTNILDNLGSDVNDPSVQANVASSVKEAENQVIQNQKLDSTRTADTLLSSAQLTSLIYDEEGPGFYISITVMSVAGKSATSNLVL